MLNYEYVKPLFLFLRIVMMTKKLDKFYYLRYGGFHVYLGQN
jgi:hypothetical protein